MVARMCAHRERDGEFFAFRDRFFVDRPQVGRRHQIDAGFGLAAQHQPSCAGIGPAVFGVHDIVEGGGNIRPAIHFVLQMNRQPGQIDIVAGDDHLVDGRFGGIQLDNFLRRLQSAIHFAEQILGRNAERLRHATPTPGHATDQLGLLGAGLAKQDGLFIAVHARGNIGQVYGVFDHFDLAFFDHSFDEPPQPEFIQIRHRIVF